MLDPVLRYHCSLTDKLDHNLREGGRKEEEEEEEREEKEEEEGKEEEKRGRNRVEERIREKESNHIHAPSLNKACVCVWLIDTLERKRNGQSLRPLHATYNDIRNNTCESNKKQSGFPENNWFPSH